MALSTLPICAQEVTGNLIPLTFEKPEIDPELNVPRTPVRAPRVSLDGHTLYFFDEMDFFVNFYVLDEDGEKTLEYSSIVLAQTEILTLPSTLTGSYVIEVIRGEQHFWGEIEL